MTVSMGMLIFAGLGYALEKDEPDTMFYTLPQVFYYIVGWFVYKSRYVSDFVLGHHHYDQHRLRRHLPKGEAS